MTSRLFPSLCGALLLSVLSLGCGASAPLHIGEPVGDDTLRHLQASVCEEDEVISGGVTVIGAERAGEHIRLRLRHGGCGPQSFAICRSPRELMSMPPQTQYFVSNITDPSDDVGCRVYRESVVSFVSQSIQERPSSLGNNSVRLSMPMPE